MISTRLKQLSYLVRPRPWALEKPIVIQFPVIDICNSQCQMCRIWENKKSTDIQPDDLRRGLRNPLFSEVRTIGINGGEPTLRKDLASLVRVLFEELKSLKGISLITNAYRYQEVIERIGEIGTIAHEYGATFDVMVSLDGYGDVHDRVRGKPGNFQRAEKVLDFVETSGLVDSVRIGCTIIKSNVYGLHDLFDYCIKRNVYLKYRLGIPHQRLYTQDLKDPYALSFAEKVHVAEFLEGLIQHYEPGEQQRFFYRSLIDQIIHHAPRKAGCDWQHRGATITSKGELLYCAVQSKPLGLIQKDDSFKAYFDNQPHLRQIIDTKCDSCNHDYVGVMPPLANLKRLARKASGRILAANIPGTSGVKNQARAAVRIGRFALRKHKLGRLTSDAPLAISSVAASDAGASKEILICGWYGTETLGDKAILGGLVTLLRDVIADCRISLVSLNKYISDLTIEQMPELGKVEVLSVAEGIARASSASLTIFGGGPLMAIDQIADMQKIFGTAKKAGKPTLVAACGVGPLGAFYLNAGIRDLLKSADLRIYRDSASMKAAAGLGVAVSSETDFVAEDPAFTWLEKARPLLPARMDNGSKTLILGLRKFPADEYARDVTADVVEQWNQRFESSLLSSLETLVQQVPGLRILPLPMCTNHFGHDDRWYYRKLFRSSTSLSGALDLSLLNQELAPIEYAAAFHAADAALTMRFHALVFALGLSVPALAIDYTIGKGKVRSLADKSGVACLSYDAVDQEALSSKLLALLREPRREQSVPLDLPKVFRSQVEKLLA